MIAIIACFSGILMISFGKQEDGSSADSKRIA
jgi:hypothetical protein